MVQKIHRRSVIWVPSFPPHAGHLSEKRMTTKLSSMKMSMNIQTNFQRHFCFVAAPRNYFMGRKNLVKTKKHKMTAIQPFNF